MKLLRIFLIFILGYMTFLTITSALSENDPMRIKRSLIKKRFYDFGSRSIHANDNNDDGDDWDNFNDEYDRYRRFYDFGSRKRFYDFGSKKRADE